ncbi:MAG: helix-turn-helix domain-containing protein [Gemmatimonadales bacterium]
MATKNPQRLSLGQALQVARKRAGLTTDEIEPLMGWYGGKLRRVEAGSRTVARTEIDRLADLYDSTRDERDRLHLIADSARRRESPSRVADFAQTYVTLERAATSILFYDAELIHALLQTRDYATAVVASVDGEDVPGRAEDRIARQQVLTTDRPPMFRAVLGEAALYREVGGIDGLRAQLEHLLVAMKHATIGVRILPFSAGAHRALGVGFTLLRNPDPSLTRVYIEGVTHATYIHEAHEVEVYADGFEDLWSRALSERDSARILRGRIETIGGSHG